MTPSEHARQEIDRQLTLAGWQLQDYATRNYGAALGVAIREFRLTTGRADYLLVVKRKIIGVVEAKPAGHTLIGVEGQTAKYSAGLPRRPKAWRDPLPFLYQSTGIETRFTNLLDPEPRSRNVFSFHCPETLLAWVKETETLRARLRMMQPLVRGRLWPVQVQTIQNLERSLAQDKPRALVHMATGSGKTFVAVSQVYRLIKHAKAERVLFLVDRTNLGLQAEAAFKQYETPDDGRKFTELYNIQHLRSNTLDKTSKVVIGTIQRVYSMLKGEELDEEAEAVSKWEQEEDSAPRTVSYHPELPPETFDFVIIDECHRSIYNLWREVLDYFDVYLIGLTATPSQHTYAFFHQNLVQEYTRQDAVADGINVDGWVYRIRTKITERGEVIEAGEVIEKRDRQTRQSRWEALDEMLVYGASELDREVVAPNQIRLIVRTLKEKLQQELFGARTLVPKTLIFAKDDAHAEIITQIVREEFGKGNDFCQKITYKVTGTSPDTLIKAFRNSTNPRIAVTVDMIATDTDIKALEVLVFMRRVKSALLFEQMLGRGTRVISSDDLQAVSGEEAQSKAFFVIVDTVGVVEHPKVSTQTMNRKRSVPFKKLLASVTDGDWEEDTLLTLAGRLGRLGRTLTPEDDAAIKATSSGMSVPDLAHALLDALDPDRVLAVAQAATGEASPSQAALDEAGEALREEVALLIADNPTLRQTLLRVHARDEVIIDELSADHLLEAGLDQSATEMARQTVQAFEAYLEKHKDEIAALQILYERPQRAERLTFQHVKELADRLHAPPRRWAPDTLWHAYAKLNASKVRNGTPRVLTDLVALVRHVVVGVDEALVPYPQQVQQRYEAWLSYYIESSDNLSLKYLFYLLSFLSLGSLDKSTAIPSLRRDDLYALPLPPRPLAEQRRIVAEIETLFTQLDVGVAALERALRNLQRYKASVLKAACEERLVPQDPNDEPASALLQRIESERRAAWEAEQLAKMRAKGKMPKGDKWKREYKEPAGPDTTGLGALPAGWVWARLEQIAEVMGGLTKNRKRASYALQLPYLRVANVYANELMLDEVKTIGVKETELERVLLKKQDLLIVEGNGSIDQIGRVALWDGSITPCVHQNHLIKARLLWLELGKFVLYWLLSVSGREQIIRVTSSTSGLHTLSLSKVSALPIPLPPLPEQRRIVSEVERRLSLIAQAETIIDTNLKRAARLRQSILKRAFEGKLVAQNAPDEPASALLARIRAEKPKTKTAKKARKGKTKKTRRKKA